MLKNSLDFISFWKNKNFNDCNESDIREDFITPLLLFLGYSKNTTNDILREKNLKLIEPLQRVGRKRIAIDYIPTVRLKKFWIIEAKPGTSKKISFGDYLQAYLYAIHPEVRAQYIVLTNGHEIRIYDVHTANSWSKTLLVSKQEDAEQTFPKLAQFLSAKTILRSIREQTLRTIRESMSIETDENSLSELKVSISEIIKEMRPVIKENARTLQRKAWKEKDEKNIKELQNCSLSNLLIQMDIPTMMLPIFGREVLRRLQDSSQLEIQKMVDELTKTYRGRPHAIFRVHCIDVFARLFAAKISVNKTLYVNSIVDCLQELVENNMNYWARNDLSNALMHLDNTILRLSMKLCIRYMMKPLEKYVIQIKKSLAHEDLIIEKPSVAKNMIGMIDLTAESLWRKYSTESNAENVWNSIWTFEILEEKLDNIPAPKYPDNDTDLLHFQSYGRGFDILCMGTWDILSQTPTDAKNNLPKNIQRVITMTREEVMNSIPKSKIRPANWKPLDKNFDYIWSYPKGNVV